MGERVQDLTENKVAQKDFDQRIAKFNGTLQNM